MDTTISTTSTRRTWLSLILLSYVLLAALYSVIVPLGEGPDEPGHAKYVFFLAREGRLPVQCAAPCESEVPGEGHQPPLAYLLASPALWWLPREERTFDLPGNRRFVWAGGSDTNAVGHGNREFWPWSGEVLAWHLARLMSVACGVATVAFTYLAARELRVAPLLAASLAAFNPQFLFASALLTNDALLTALCALILWLVVRPAPGVGRRRAAWLGLLFGLTLLTKQNALLLAPILAGWAWLGSVGAERTIGRSGMRAAIVFGVALGVSGWWFARNWQLYGDPLALAVFQAEFATQPFEPGRWQAWLGGLALLHESFWARFGWMNVVVRRRFIAVFALIELAALAGLVWRWRADGCSLRTWRLWWPLAAFALLALAWVVAFAVSAGLVAWQGRLLFPALPAIAILLAAGIAALWDAVLPRRDGLRRVLAPAGVALLAVLALWMPFGVIQPAYPPQTVPEAVALAHIGTPVYGRFAARQDERGAELRGVDVSGIPRAGETLQVTLWWHALGRQNRAWQVFIHLVDADDTILAEDNREPRDGQFRMPLWSEGDWIKDTHPLVVPDLPPGTYRIRVGLWYPITGGRAGLFDKRDKLRGEFIDAATIIIPE